MSTDKTITVHSELSRIQQALKVGKTHHNKFGNYDYRNAEDILEAVKPLLGESVLKVSDKPILLGDRYYIEATATLIYNKEIESASASAREGESQPGMSPSQITGAASSYARKYALNGLFLIDDARDADSDEKEPQTTQPSTPKIPPREALVQPQKQGSSKVVETTLEPTHNILNGVEYTHKTGVNKDDGSAYEGWVPPKGSNLKPIWGTAKFRAAQQVEKAKSIKAEIADNADTDNTAEFERAMNEDDWGSALAEVEASGDR